jgi:hypothetical protein
MTHACCPDCRLRFTPAVTAYLLACPACGEPLQPVVGLAKAVGYRLFRLEDAPHSLPEAVAVSMPIPILEWAGHDRRARAHSAARSTATTTQPR